MQPGSQVTKRRQFEGYKRQSRVDLPLKSISVPGRSRMALRLETLPQGIWDHRGVAAATVEIRSGQRRVQEYLFFAIAEISSETMHEREVCQGKKGQNEKA